MQQLIACSAPIPGMSLLDIRRYLSADKRPRPQADALLRTHGIKAAEDASENVVIPIDTCWRLFAEHAALVDDEMHCIFGTRLRPGTTSLIVARMLLANTLEEALRAYCESSSVLLPELDVAVHRRANAVSLRWRCSSAGEVHHLAMEGMAIVYYALLCWLADSRLPLMRVRAPAARRSANASLLHALNVPIIHDGDDVELFFSPEVADNPVARRDIGAWQDGVYQVLCATTLEQQTSAAAGTFTTRVKTAMLEGVDQKTLAYRWQMSTKTIARRLDLEGSSFRKVRDEIRIHKATSLIHAGLTVEAIGDLLGYEDSRSFRRAFKRWFGVSPSLYRATAKGRSGVPKSPLNGGAMDPRSAA